MTKTKVKTNKPVFLGMSILDIRKTLCMNFGMTILNKSTKTTQNHATWILFEEKNYERILCT